MAAIVTENKINGVIFGHIIVFFAFLFDIKASLNLLNNCSRSRVSNVNIMDIFYYLHVCVLHAVRSYSVA